MFIGDAGMVHGGESARLPPLWPGFDYRNRRHMWIEFAVWLSFLLLPLLPFPPPSPTLPVKELRHGLPSCNAKFDNEVNARFLLNKHGKVSL